LLPKPVLKLLAEVAPPRYVEFFDHDFHQNDIIPDVTALLRPDSLRWRLKAVKPPKRAASSSRISRIVLSGKV
jgi:hypothetical protein